MIAQQKVGRLGNESISYADLGLKETFEFDGDKKFTIDNMFTFIADQNNDYESLSILLSGR